MENSISFDVTQTSDKRQILNLSSPNSNLSAANKEYVDDHNS